MVADLKLGLPPTPSDGPNRNKVYVVYENVETYPLYKVHETLVLFMISLSEMLRSFTLNMISFIQKEIAIKHFLKYN